MMMWLSVLGSCSMKRAGVDVVVGLCCGGIRWSEIGVNICVSVVWNGVAGW